MTALFYPIAQAQENHIFNPTLRAVFFDEPAAPLPENLGVEPPSFEGKAFVRGKDGKWITLRSRGGEDDGTDQPPTAGTDRFIGDGAETDIAVDIANINNAVSVQNQGFTTSPSLRTTADGNVNWTSRTFPNGGGTYTGSPFDPWAQHGNAANTLFSLLIRRDTGSANTHCVVARSTDSGVTWPLFFERMKNVFQDRAMFDVDRTTALGGGSGSTHDGKIYMGYDDWGVNGGGYAGSWVQVISSTGTAVIEPQISSAAVFNGTQLQPVAGVNDGQCYVMSLAQNANGSNRILLFHELTNGGANVTLNKSNMTFPTTGQSLGGSLRWGVNGHRINSHMFMAIDRTNGPRRGWLFVISNRNPTQGNPAFDQGDVYLSYSANGAVTWTSAILPGQTPGKTQFFAMMDVDDNGWLHVAYYQNESGATNGGVLNANTARVYYMISYNGGSTWTAPIVINDAANNLDYFDPPPNLAGQSYYLVGDYQRVRAAGAGCNTRAYILWTGYDKDRNDVSLNNKRERVICTTITNVTRYADIDCNGIVNVTDLLAVINAWGACPPPCPPNCPADVVADCNVNVSDLLAVINNWG